MNINPTKPLWTLEEAIALVQKHEPLAKALGLHLGLTGSVLFTGSSAKDLDLVVYGHKNRKPTGTELKRFLGGIGLRYPTDGSGVGDIVDNYLEYDRSIIICGMAEDGRRVDVLVMN